MFFLIRIEGCNFASTLYDTGDLSTIRGASRAYLKMPELWPNILACLGSIDCIVVGASDGIYRLASTKFQSSKAVSTELDSLTRQPFGDDDVGALIPFLSFAHAVIEEGRSYKDDVLRLTALCRAQQLRRLTVDVPDVPPSGSLRPCPVDRVRPAVVEYVMPDGRKKVSASVMTRRAYGRSVRDAFYADELGAIEKLAVIDSFQDLVTDYGKNKKCHAAPKGLPPSLQNKLAVIYMDGNKFTAIRETIVFGPKASDGAETARGRHGVFADHVREARRRMLKSLLDHFKAQPAMWHCNKGGLNELRFETLLWGGDEAMLVIPAWALMAAMPALSKNLDDPRWRHEDHMLSHAVGIAICNVKTPISVAKALAEEIANTSKSVAGIGATLANLRNVYSIQILESVEPPRTDLGRFRETLYGASAPRAFALVGSAEVDSFLNLMRKFVAEDGGLPRSQLFGLIAKARARDLFKAANVKAAREFLDNDVKTALKRAKCNLLPELQKPELGFTEKTPLLPLIRLAEFGDYIDPLPQAASARAA